MDGCEEDAGSGGDCATASEDGEEDASTSVPDPRDFAAVYGAKAGRLRAYAVSLLRGAGLVDRAEDVVQDAILALWKRFQATGEVPNDWFAVTMNKVKYCALDLVDRGADVGRAETPRALVVDTLGAGDILHGAFCWSYLHSGGSFVASLGAAAQVASMSCRYLGTRRWIDDL